jgi:hypothetical protein
MRCGPSSAANVRDSPSIAAQATPKPAVEANADRAGEAESVGMTPDRLCTIVSRRSPCRQKLRGRPCHDRKNEIVPLQLDQRNALNDAEADGVEGDIDAARLPGHRGRVPFYRVLIERIDARRLGLAASGNDISCHGFDRRGPATTEKDFDTLTGEGARHRAANGSSGAMDHSDFASEQHDAFLRLSR